MSPDFGVYRKTLRSLRFSESWRIRLRKNFVADVARLRRAPENAASTPLLRILALYEILWRLRKNFASSQLLAIEKILVFSALSVFSCSIYLFITVNGYDRIIPSAENSSLSEWKRGLDTRPAAFSSSAAARLSSVAARSPT